MYFKAGSGQQIKPVENDRPSANWVGYQDEELRSALESIGWSYDFQHNPTKVGGASVRVIVERINARKSELFRSIVAPLRTYIDRYRIARAIASGILPENPTWQKWQYIEPSDLTADRKYEIESAALEIDRGALSPQQLCASRNRDWKQIQDETIEWHRRLIDRANALGVPVEMLIQQRRQSAAAPLPNNDTNSA